MPLEDIHHIAIKVKPGTLKAAEDFYVKVLGLSYADRPDLGFPGAWLNVNKTMIHLVEEEFPPEMDPWYARPEARSAIDHIAIKARGFDAYKKRVIETGLDWRQTHLPEAGLWQLFVLDVSGVIIELNFKIGEEPPGSVGPDSTRRYPPNVIKEPAKASE